MKTIQRKTMLYETAVEYGDFCMNHVKGCAHGCRYCYAFLNAKRYGQVGTYDEWCDPKLVSNALEIIAKEAPKYKGKVKSVQMCFTTDPFMVGYPEVGQMSLKAIEELNSHSIPCMVLTKGILPKQLADEKRFSRANCYGITLVSLNEAFRRTWEPNASPLKDRLKALRYLHEAGCRTWISMEPYPTPNIIEQDLRLLLDAVSFADKIIFSRWNYSREISAYAEQKQFYNEQVGILTAYCKKHKIEYYIKEGTVTSK